MREPGSPVAGASWPFAGRPRWRRRWWFAILRAMGGLCQARCWLPCAPAVIEQLGDLL